MTTKTDITLPPFPDTITKLPIDHDGNGPLVWKDDEVRAYARAAVEADRQRRMPSDAELKAWGQEEEFFLFCDPDEFLDIVKSALARYGSSQPDTPPAAISRDLLGRIVDEVFDGAIEDTSPIEDIYRVIVREYGQSANFGQGETRTDAGSSARNEGDSGQPAASAEPGETEALRDMLDDARSDLEMLRNALGVPVEPHQNLLERMLDAAKVAAPVVQDPFAYVWMTEDGERLGVWAKTAADAARLEPVCGEPPIRLYAAPVAQEPVTAEHDIPSTVDAKALSAAQEIALMWGADRSQFVSKIQVAVIEAMRWAQYQITAPVAAQSSAVDAALRTLESACDALCSLRTQEQYLSMIGSGQKDALQALDDARSEARRVLAVPVAAQEQPWQALAAAMYQAAGAYDMPVRILDALSAAANDEPFAHLIDGLLPIECPEVNTQDREDAIPDRDAVDLAREGMALYQAGMAEHIICKELVRIADVAGASNERAAHPQPENIRTGDPYDDPAFEALAREHDVWGRASSALCAAFWRAGRGTKEVV